MLTTDTAGLTEEREKELLKIEKDAVESYVAKAARAAIRG